LHIHDFCWAGVPLLKFLDRKKKSVIPGLLMWQTAEPIVVSWQDRELMQELVSSGTLHRR
jgi:hypothetical protein